MTSQSGRSAGRLSHHSIIFFGAGAPLGIRTSPRNSGWTKISSLFAGQAVDLLVNVLAVLMRVCDFFWSQSAADSLAPSVAMSNMHNEEEGGAKGKRPRASRGPCNGCEPQSCLCVVAVFPYELTVQTEKMSRTPNSRSLSWTPSARLYYRLDSRHSRKKQRLSVCVGLCRLGSHEHQQT